MIELTCGWCNVDCNRDILDFEEGPNLWECSDCGKENLAYGEVEFRVVEHGKYIPASPSYCPECNADLSKLINIDTRMCSMLCPHCRKPITIHVERVESE